MTEVRIGDIRRRIVTDPVTGRSAELSARVEGLTGAGEDRLWFRVPESYEDWVSRGAEPFLAALLPAAMVLGRRLKVEGAPVSPYFLHGCRQIIQLYHRWDPKLALVPVDAGCLRAPQKPSGRAVGCFFTGGVDSCYTLLKNLDREDGDGRITHLIFARGYADCPLSNAPLFRNLSERMEGTAAGLKLHFIAASTNLKSFTPPPGPGWDRYAGSQLASVGLALGEGLRRVYVPAGDTYATLSAWGSHPQVDPLWSLENLEFRHDGCEAYRSQKLEWYVASSRPVMENLRVCGYESSGLRNCGRCEKCLRTMIGLAALGVEIPRGLFAEELDPARVRALDGGDRVIRYYLRDNLRLLTERGLATEVEAAARAALRPSAVRWLRRKVYAGGRELDRRWLDGRLRRWALRAAGRNAQQQAELRVRPVKFLLRESWDALFGRVSRSGRHVL